MRALTLTQPWASLVVAGLKQYETRSWKTPHRGLLAIHAAKGFPNHAHALCLADPFLSALASIGITAPEQLPTAAILGYVTVVEMLPTAGDGCPKISETEFAFGDYSPGRWAWQLARPSKLAVPKPVKGKQGLWRVPVVEAV